MVTVFSYRMSTMLVVVFSAFIFAAKLLQAAEPATKLAPYPTKAELERYEDNEEMYASLLLEYYRTASVLEAQLHYWGVAPNTTVVMPTLDEITSQETKTLKKFHSIASKLLKQIEQLPEEELHAHLYDIEKRLIDERKTNAELHVKNFELELKSQSAESYATRIYEIIKQFDGMKRELDSISYLYYMLKFSSNSAMVRALDDSFIPSIMLSNSGQILSFGADGINTDLSYGAKAEVNLNTFSNIGKYLDVWFAYLMPQIKSNSLYKTTGTPWREWNSNIYSLGVNLNFHDIIDLYHSKAGIKIGGGYYWGSATSPNIGLPKVDYKGGTLNLELNFSKLTTISPANLYFNFGVLFPTRQMIYSDPVQPLNIYKSTITTYGIGLRFNVL